MAITIDTTTGNVDGLVTAGAGPEDSRPMVGGNVHATPGQRVKARGRLVLDADGETVKFVPLDQDELDAVAEADS
jgi:hypothetical protein